jgi:hypothetical protein
VPLEGAHLERGQRAPAHRAHLAAPASVVVHQVGVAPPAWLVVLQLLPDSWPSPSSSSSTAGPEPPLPPPLRLRCPRWAPCAALRSGAWGAGRMRGAAGRMDGWLLAGRRGLDQGGDSCLGPLGSFKGSWVKLRGSRTISSCQSRGTKSPQPMSAADGRNTDLAALAGTHRRLRGSSPAPEGSPRWRGCPRPGPRASIKAALTATAPSGRLSAGLSAAALPGDRPVERPGTPPGAPFSRASSARGPERTRLAGAPNWRIFFASLLMPLKQRCGIWAS